MRRLHLLFLLCGLTLALGSPSSGHAAAAPAPDEATKLAQKFEFGATRPDTPELTLASKQLELIKRRADAGTATSDEVFTIQSQVEALQRHVPYQLYLRSNGGSLQELVTRISGSRQFIFTIVNAGEASDMDTLLPAFELRNVSWVTIVEVLDNFLAARRLQLKIVGFETSEDPRASRSVICVLRRLDPPPNVELPSTGFDSFQLTDYLTGQQTVDTIVDAIRTAWTMDPKRSADALQIKYHAATNLLFVSGPRPALVIARQVIAGLHQKKPLIP